MLFRDKFVVGPIDVKPKKPAKFTKALLSTQPR